MLLGCVRTGRKILTEDVIECINCGVYAIKLDT